jgi:hypothetical protein
VQRPPVYGCPGLALAYEKGLGVERDLAKARALYERSCEHHRSDACFDLGRLHRDALGGEADPA